MRQFEDEVIWITGASSGIGEALAYELNKYGSRLIISSRSQKGLDLVKKRCAYPKKVMVLALDLADFDKMPVRVEKAVAAFGKVDILINNAGISQRSLIADTQFEVFKKLIDIDYLGTIALTKALLPHFLTNSRGHFVTVTSLMGKFGSPLRSGYCGAKHALHGFFDVLRMEHERDGIAVTLICPGFVRTNVAKNALTAYGNSKNTSDPGTENGMPADKFARKMIRAIGRKKFEAYIGGKEVMGIYLKRLFPRLLHKVVLKSKVV
jgi:short-subunit dehydrogenase